MEPMTTLGSGNRYPTSYPSILPPGLAVLIANESPVETLWGFLFNSTGEKIRDDCILTK